MTSRNAKLESRGNDMDTHGLWQGSHAKMGYKANAGSISDNNWSFLDKLNTFYARFEQ